MSAAPAIVCHGILPCLIMHMLIRPELEEEAESKKRQLQIMFTRFTEAIPQETEAATLELWRSMVTKFQRIT